MKALVIDDCAVSVATISKLLKSYGDVVTANTGEDGLQILEQASRAGDPFDVLCVDISMPEMDGFGVMKRVAQMGLEPLEGKKPLAILMTTGQSEIRTVLKAMDLGCNGYLTKPISEENLSSELFKLGYYPSPTK